LAGTTVSLTGSFHSFPQSPLKDAWMIPLLSGFNPTSVGVGVTVVPITTFTSVFYTGGHASGLSKLCHLCMTDVQKRLKRLQFLPSQTFPVSGNNHPVIPYDTK